jgi:uncharacterized protein YkwD
MKSLSYHNVLQQKVLHQNTPQRASVTRLGALLVTLLLASCGGGGKSYPETVYKDAVEPGAVLLVPAANYADARRTAAFNRLNDIRQQAGMGLLTQNSAIDQAAQKHSAYQVVNSAIGHEEQVGMPEFVNSDYRFRMTHFGYDLHQNGYTEVTAALDKFDKVDSAEAGIILVDGLMTTPYHRNEMLRANLIDVGVGIYNDKATTVLTIDIAKTSTREQGAPDNIAFIWPPNNATDVLKNMHRENPNPIPENGSLPAGYPASVHVNGEFRLIKKVDKFEMRDPSGNLVNTKLIIPGDFAAIIPRSPLAKNTRYTVNFETETNEYRPVTIKKSWSFTTGDKTEY